MKITRFSSSDAGSTGSGGGASGPAGGDLGGGYPAPSVTGLQGTPICTTTPTTGEVLTFNGTEWCPATPGSADHKVLVDGSDTTADYLYSKLAAGSGISLAILSAGGDEQVEISTASGGVSGTRDWLERSTAKAFPPHVTPSGSGFISTGSDGRVSIYTTANNEYGGILDFLGGTLYRVFVRGATEHASDSTIYLSRSYDYGQTWSSPTSIATGSDGSHHATDPSILALSSGRLLVQYGDQLNSDPTHCSVKTIYSDDGGLTWSTPYDIPAVLTGNEAAGTSQPLELPNGEIVIAGNVTQPTTLISVLWHSTDGGATFPTQTTIANGVGTREYAEPTIRLVDGAIVCLMRSDTNQHTWRSVCTDWANGSFTWSSPADVVSMSGRPDFIEFFPGALILLARNNNTQFYPYWSVSWDKGVTWTTPALLDAGETRAQDYCALWSPVPGAVLAIYALENSGSNTTIYRRWFFDGYGTDQLGNLKTLATTAGATGATAASRYVGGTTSGAPASGTFLVGDFVVDQSGFMWVCTAAGSPGTWTQIGSTISLPPAHAHVQNVVFSGDGSTTAWVLPAAPVNDASVSVFVGGSRSQDWTLSGSLLDTITFGSAPASASNNIVIDIVAALA